MICISFVILQNLQSKISSFGMKSDVFTVLFGELDARAPEIEPCLPCFLAPCTPVHNYSVRFWLTIDLTGTNRRCFVIVFVVDSAQHTLISPCCVSVDCCVMTTMRVAYNASRM